MIRFAWLFALFCAANLASAAPSDEWRRSPKPIRDAVRASVEAQLTALKEGNFAQAYEYASLAVREKFSPALFAAMIRRGYPALVRHASADLGSVRDDGRHRARASVTVFDRLNRATNYRYLLIEEDEGWRIDGVIEETVGTRKEI